MGEQQELRQSLVSHAEGVIEETKEPSYDKFLYSLLGLRLVVNLSLTIVNPTMPDYMISLGGSVSDYYWAGALFCLCQFFGTLMIGIFVDRNSRHFFHVHVLAGVLVVIAHVIYALAGPVAVLRRPSVVIASRCLAGFCASVTVGSQLFVGEMLKDSPRQEWIVKFGMTRSQGIFWGPPLGMLLSIMSTSKTGFWGAYTLPGWFCAAAALLSLMAVFANFVHLPIKTPSGDTLSGIGSFLCRPRVFAVLLTTCIMSFSISVAEFVIPVLTRTALGWRGAVCGMPLTIMAVTLFLGQLLVMALFRAGVSDRVPLLVSSLLYPLVLLVTVVIWNRDWDTGIISVLWSFVLVPPLGVWGNLAGLAAFTRLVGEDLPEKKGITLTVMNNVLMLCTTAGPMYLLGTYSDPVFSWQPVPRESFDGMVVMHIVSATMFLFNYARLRPKTSRHSGRAVAGPFPPSPQPARKIGAF